MRRQRPPLTGLDVLKMSDPSSAVSAELEALSSKRASLKDKLKKRREKMGSILNMATAAAAATAPTANSPSKCAAAATVAPPPTKLAKPSAPTKPARPVVTEPLQVKPGAKQEEEKKLIEVRVGVIVVEHKCTVCTRIYSQI